jgi:hypothetical protein
MLKLTLLLAVLFVAVQAQAQDEVSGQQNVITVAAPTGGYSCGRASYPEYCYGVPANVGGSFWLDCSYKAGNGFIVFFGVADLGQATIDSAMPTYGTNGGLTQLNIKFHGMTNDGDGDTYTGTGRFTFSYYVGHCSGRGCGNPTVQLMQSGSLTITYN